MIRGNTNDTWVSPDSIHQSGCICGDLDDPKSESLFQMWAHSEIVFKKTPKIIKYLQGFWSTCARHLHSSREVWLLMCLKYQGSRSKVPHDAKKKAEKNKKKHAFRYQNHIIRTNVKFKSVCPNRLPLKRHGQAIRVKSNDNLFGSIVTEQQQSGIDSHEPLIVLRKFLPGWWFHPSWKICSSNWKFIPHRGENKKYLKPPPPPSYIAVEDALFSNAHPPLTRKPGKQHHRRRGPFHLSSYRRAIVWSTKMIQNGERVGCLCSDWFCCLLSMLSKGSWRCFSSCSVSRNYV